jgi:hypothetical protein
VIFVPTQVFKYANAYVKAPWIHVNKIITMGIYHDDEIDFSTMTKSMYGFNDNAINASIEPIGIATNIDNSARPQYGLTYGHMNL